MKTLSIALATCAVTLASTARANPLDTLNPGEWYEVPSSHLRDVFPANPPGDPACVIDCWSGGAFDTARGRLVIFGGGHGQYAGNEIYVFDVESLAWTRLTDPSTDTGGVEASGYYPDGLPRSQHTYGYLAYIPSPFDRFCTLGNAALYPSGQTSTAHTDCFDFSTKAWERYADQPGGPDIGGMSAIDSSTGHAWYHGIFSGSTLAEFDPSSRTWTNHGGQYTESVYVDGYATADIDPIARKFVSVGNGHVIVWDISKSGDIAGEEITTTGATDLVAIPHPGFVYVPTLASFVGWAGGDSLYRLDIETKAWAKVANAATNTVIPTAQNANGTFGRFRYVPSKHALIVVNGSDENVFVYKVTNGTEPLPDGGSAPPQSSDGGAVAGGGAGGSGSSAGANGGANGAGSSPDAGGSGGCSVAPGELDAAWCLLVPAFMMRRRSKSKR